MKKYKEMLIGGIFAVIFVAVLGGLIITGISFYRGMAMIVNHEQRISYIEQLITDSIKQQTNKSE